MPMPTIGSRPFPGKRPFGAVRLSGTVSAVPPPTAPRLLPPDWRPGPSVSLAILDLGALRRMNRSP